MSAPQRFPTNGCRSPRCAVLAALLPAFALALTLLSVPALARADDRAGSSLAGTDAREDARGLATLAGSALAAVVAGDRQAARAGYMDFTDRWSHVEDGIRARDKAAYVRIESLMEDVNVAVPASGEWRRDEAKAALAALRDACTGVAESRAPVAPPAHGPADIARYRRDVGHALETLAKGDAAASSGEVQRLREAWPDVEALVKTRDPRCYATCEEALAQADRELRSASPDRARATGALERVSRALAPLEGAVLQYGAIDIGLILLREGAEAILVLAALVSFLGRMGAREKVRLVWAGGAAGLAASLVCGLGLAAVFRGAASASAHREIVEGVSSLLAAALLVVVGQWLHAKMHRGGWKTDVKEALEGGRSLPLALVAFLAVFREGAETVLFCAGIAPSLDAGSALLGLAGGGVALVVLAVAVVGLGKRVPLGPFFRAATFLLWALAVKFVGEGVHALQAGSVVPATGVEWLPSFPLLGLHPTVETCSAQALALLVWLGFALVPRFRRRMRKASSPEKQTQVQA